MLNLIHDSELSKIIFPRLPQGHIVSYMVTVLFNNPILVHHHIIVLIAYVSVQLSLAYETLEYSFLSSLEAHQRFLNVRTFETYVQ